MRLTARQERFVAEYAVSRNGAAAARAAGYAHSSAKVTASRLLTKDNLQAALQARERELRRLLGTTRDQVLLEIQNAIDIARVKGEPMAMVSGWREIARMCGFYRTKPERTLRMTGAGRRLKADIEAMSDEELMKCAGIVL
jgi:phage terminase small subunit